MGRRARTDGFGNMLFNSVLQPVGGTAFTPAFFVKQAEKQVGNDVLLALQKSNVIYEFSCHFDSRYLGRTSHRLQHRIKQHVSKSIRSCSSSHKCLLPARQCKSSTQNKAQFLASDSAIGLHL